MRSYIDRAAGVMAIPLFAVGIAAAGATLVAHHVLRRVMERVP